MLQCSVVYSILPVIGLLKVCSKHSKMCGNVGSTEFHC